MEWATPTQDCNESGVTENKLSIPRKDEEQWYHLVVLECVLASTVIFNEPGVTILDKLGC